MVSIIFKGILEPKGGPSGYLYNLQESLEHNDIQNIKIISMQKSDNNRESFLKKLKSVLKNKVKLPHYVQEKRKISLYKDILEKNITIIKNSKIIHFHTTQDMYYFSKIYDLSKHIILLMSHSPEPSNIEVYNSFISMGYTKSEANKKKQLQKKADVFAFQNANYLIFPCEGAVSPYDSFFTENKIDKSKLRYVITASKPLIPKLSIEEFKDKFNIPKDKKIISYVGRKNKIKGFDIFCNIAKELKDNSNLFFISAGIGDIDAHTQDNFLDIGWTDDPASLVNASDIQIVPNRDTYFDLGIIQTMSINTTIITTNTGGNSWFEYKDINMYFADANDVASFIKILQNNEIFQTNFKNQEFYKEYLNNEIFANSYQEMYQAILETK